MSISKQKKEKKIFTISFLAFLLTITVSLFLLFFFLVYYLISLQENYVRRDSNEQLQGQVSNMVQTLVEYYMLGAAGKLEALHNMLTNPHVFPNGLNPEVLMSIMENDVVSDSKISALYFGTEDGNFYMVKRLNKNIVSKRYITNNNKMITARWVHPKNSAQIYAEQYNPYEQFSVDEGKGYDPRKRAWYKIASNKLEWTNPYIFFTDKLPGITGVKKVVFNDSIKGVVAVDISLTYLSDFLKSLSFSNLGSVVIVDEDNHLIALQDKKNPSFQQFYNLSKDSKSAAASELSLINVNEINSSDVLQHFVKTVIHPSTNNALSSASGKEKKDILSMLLPLFFPSYLKSTTIHALLLRGLTTGNFIHSNANYIYTSQRVHIMDGLSWYIYTFTDTLELNSSLRYITKLIVYLFIVFIVMFFLFTYKISKIITSPLLTISRLMQGLQQLILGEKFVGNKKFQVKEIRSMGDTYNKIRQSLLSLEKFVPKEIVLESITSEKQLTVAMKSQQNITVFFSDIKNFTNIAEKISPEILCKCLEVYFSDMSFVIKKNKGIIDKFIGDAIMALYGIFDENQNTAMQAMLAALEMEQAENEINKKIKQYTNAITFISRMGINTGEVMSGIVGSDVRFNHTVIGDTVNLASRFEAANKQYGTNIIVSEATMRHSDGTLVFRYLDNVQVRGKEKFVKIYHLIGKVSDVSQHTIDFVAQNNRIFELFDNGNIQDARSLFEKLGKQYDIKRDIILSYLQHKLFVPL